MNSPFKRPIAIFLAYIRHIKWNISFNLSITTNTNYVRVIISINKIYPMQKSRPSQKPVVNESQLSQLIQEAEKEVLKLGSLCDEADKKAKLISEQLKNKQIEVSKLQKQQQISLEKQEKIGKYQVELSSLQQLTEEIDAQLQQKMAETNDQGFKLGLIESEYASIKAKENEVQKLLQTAKKNVSKKDFIEKENAMVGRSRQNLSNLNGQWAELQVDKLNEELGEIGQILKQVQPSLQQQRQIMQKLKRQLSRIRSNAAANSKAIQKIKTEIKAISTKGSNPYPKLSSARREFERAQLEIASLNQQMQRWDSSRLRYQKIIALLKAKIQIIKKNPQNDSLELVIVQDELQKYITQVFNINKRLISAYPKTKLITPRENIGSANIKSATGNTFEKGKKND